MSSSPIHVLFTYDCVYPESLGGVEYRDWCLAKALAQQGHRVTIAGWVNEPSSPAPGVEVLPLDWRQPLYDSKGKRGALASLIFAAAIARLDLRPYDVVCTANIPYIHVLPLAFRCWLARKKLLVTWHEYFGAYWRTYKGRTGALAYWMIEWLTAQLGDTAVAVSSLTGDRLRAHRLRGRGIPIVPAGLWLAEIRKAFERPPVAAPPLIYGGRLIPDKRIDLALRAVALLPRSSDGPLLGITGDGPDRARLEALVTELRIEDRVRFYGRLPDAEDLWHLLAHAKAALQPSAREGFGIFPLEAMALGLPVVYCSAPDNAIGSIVRDGVEGICSEPTPVALADALSKILADDTLRQRLAANARSRAAEFDWVAVAAQMEALFDELLTEARAVTSAP